MAQEAGSQPYAAPPRASFWEKLGPGGLASLLLALGGGLLLLGLPVLWRLRQVLRAAGGESPRDADLILVLGRRLEADRPSVAFEARLERAAQLWREGRAPRVLVAGGLTGAATRSEAEAGRETLLALGLPAEAILLEDRSQHTLENLFFLREVMAARGWGSLLLVSDPLHLARAGALARGLGLAFHPCPAAAAPAPGSLGWWLRAGHEAFLLHWYHTGVAYSRLIRSQRQLARIS